MQASVSVIVGAGADSGKLDFVLRLYASLRVSWMQIDKLTVSNKQSERRRPVYTDKVDSNSNTGASNEHQMSACNKWLVELSSVACKVGLLKTHIVRLDPVD
jgi:hypothetical protein